MVQMPIQPKFYETTESSMSQPEVSGYTNEIKQNSI